MYYAIVAALMLVFPLASILVDVAMHQAQPGWFLVGKWFVFWAVGVRLFLAGLRQMLQPRYTAEKILGIGGDDVLLVVRELGFANAAIGIVGILSIVATGWVAAAALAGGIFYGLAGINHALQGHRNRLENVAMASDLFAAVVLLGYCIWAATR
ncbi:hypothetical protein QTI24_14160 [Variovorax sp. J22P240]|uniref:DUF6790 family protein n=1 Tax=unclassified Variovorax TaxID=663243 RepID=UPI002574BC8F|nr:MULTISPECIES: DUF6790 family protein [unclassified Variovorax]MDL9999759.1 hypothetical protein [Variovorax sp. J22P240]MDM0049183.1 hypothetical protein [Variovorax sp. J22R115]